MGLKDVLASRGPQLAMMAMAAKQGGPQALAAFMEGIQQKEMQAQQHGRQQEADARTAELHQANLGNMREDNARQQQTMEMDKLHKAIALIQQATQQQAETATDPAQAENAILQQATSAAGVYGLEPDKLTGMVPNMSGPITGRKKKQAKEMYEQAIKTYGPEAVASDSITLTDTIFGDAIKPSQLRAMAEGQAIDASGAPVLPKAARPNLQIMDLGGKKMAVDPSQLQHGQTFAETPNPSAGGGQADTEPLVAIMGPDGAPVLVPRSQASGKRPASTREQGRPVQSGDANRIVDLDTSINDLNTLETELGTTGAASKIGAMLPNAVTEFTGWGSDAKQRQATIDRVKQVIGKALEGGVLRKEDEYKYVKILPTIGDPPEVARKKLQGLRTAIQQRRVTTLEGLADAGFDTSKFNERGQAPAADTDPLGLFK